jgi:transcriptional regulator with XRE-family HTH domain
MLNKALKLIRSYHDLSQSDLANDIGISNSYLSEIESGKKTPSLDLLKRYSDKFDIPVSSILFFSETVDNDKLTEKMRLAFAKKIVSILEWNENKNAAKKNKAETKEAV